MKEYTPTIRILVVLFIVLSAVSAHAQPLFSTTQAEVSEDSPPEDSPPEDSAEQTETSLPDHLEVVKRDSLPAHSDKKPGFFIAPLAEIIGYGREGPSFGAGFALGAGNGVAIGVRFLYVIDTESIHTMEIAIFMRAYLWGTEACTGPFVQLNTGVTVHKYKHVVFAFGEAGAFSAGIAAGWRFPLGERWYIEPSVRVGYSYIAGAGVAFAYRF